MKKIITIVLCFGCTMIAQSTTSSIKGTVKVQTRNYFQVLLFCNTYPTGSRYSALSNGEGRFSMLNMKVGGPYKVMITFIDFALRK
jgi:hypothetical protein